MPQKQKLGLEEKIEIIQDYLEGTISKSEAARRGGVTRDTFVIPIRLPPSEAMPHQSLCACDSG